MKTTTAAAVTAYIEKQPAAAQKVLKRVRALVRRALPGAEETISYGIPAYRVDGRSVVYFAGWKRHWSLYPVTPDVQAALGARLDAYAIRKGTVRFELEAPIPTALVERIVRALAKAAKARGAVRAAQAGAARETAPKRTIRAQGRKQAKR